MKRKALLICAVLAVLDCLAMYLPAHAQTPAPEKGTLAVFSETLGDGWENYSWGSSVNIDGMSPGTDSRHAIGFEVTAPYGALHLHTNNAVDTSPYAALQFSVRASAPNQLYTVGLYDGRSQQVGRPVPLSKFGVDPVANAWTTYTVPLSQDGLDAAKHQVNGIVLQSDSGDAQPIAYVSNVRFVDKTILAAATRAQRPTNAPATLSTDTKWSWFLPAVAGAILALALLIAAFAARRTTTLASALGRRS